MTKRSHLIERQDLKLSMHNNIFLKLVYLGTIIIMSCLLLTGCFSQNKSVPDCTVIFEDNPSLFFSRQIFHVKPNGDVTVSIGVPTGEQISSVNYKHYTVSGKTKTSKNYDYYNLMLHEVRYPTVIRLTTTPAGSITYHAGSGSGESITICENTPHLYTNTLPYRKQFTKEGYLPIGWNTFSDGTGTQIGFGSRTDHTSTESLELYMQWLPYTPVEYFSYVQINGEITITNCSQQGDLIIPDEIDGLPVTAIATGAFGDITATTVALPPSLKRIEPHAFSSLTVEHLYMFDNIHNLTDTAFDAYQIHHLHINAIQDPVYSGSYFDTLADKVDYLRSLEKEDKIVLFCGSSARFGYDSPMIETAFPDYKVVNMGVFAYSNMLPQARIVLHFMKEGDILLSSPELDAIDMQFCGQTDLDKETFCMMESNYDMFSLLDCREFTNIFDAFSDYQNARISMTPRSYFDSPSYYDEDGNRTEQSSYNRYGDYILYRENNTAGKSFGIKRAFYNTSHIQQSDWEGLNSMYDTFTQKGISAYFTYSPRSRISISKDSSADSITALDKALRSNLHIPVISSIESSLMEPLYFFETDNHLSTEGVRIHTVQVIKDLRKALEE